MTFDLRALRASGVNLPRGLKIPSDSRLKIAIMDSPVRRRVL
jgi:hypothetical protein